jgi:hypothetical protein
VNIQAQQLETYLRLTEKVNIQAQHPSKSKV